MVSKEKLRVMLTSGYTQEECAKEFSVTKQYISLLRKKWFPDWTRQDFGASKLVAEDNAIAQAARQTRTGRLTGRHPSDLSRAYSLYFSRKKQNVKKAGKWEFTIGIADIPWTNTCPVFGTPINWFSSTMADDSPSLDRIDNSLGYVPGNVAIICLRANRIKNDGTADEHRQIYEYMHGQPLQIK